MISPDTTIAHYRVETLIGAGGMGEVYKAVDLHLGRAVALKVLPEDLSHSRERIRRFVAEAKAASSLNHPNIITVYDAGEVDHVHFMASELVDGKTLRELIHRDRIPLKRAVSYLAQAADGIAKAHAAGIVHRDLKPDNIMVTNDGFAKVLDFGLAKLTEGSANERTATHTREGIVMGTAAYMSPEQAQGKAVDHRSDVFTFGTILYEAVARRPAFAGGSDPDILHRIIHEEPEPLNDVPGELDRLITRAMAKDPEERIQSMKDVALELRDISQSFDGLRLVKGRRRRAILPIRAWLAIAAALLIGAIAGYLVRRPGENRTPVRFAIAPPERTHFTGTPNSATALQFALSPDGNTLAFVASAADGPPQIWLRDLSAIESRLLNGTEGAWFPFWSPAGDAIGFFADEKLKRISSTGGDPIVLTDAPSPRGGTWSKDGVILFCSAGHTPLNRVSAAGGEAVAATTLRPDEYAHRWPHFLPDGRHFVYLVHSPDRKSSLHMGTLGSSESDPLTESDSGAQFVAPDELLFMRKGTLYRQRLSMRTWQPEGEPILVARQIGYAPLVNYASFSTSKADVIAFAPWVNPGRRISWLDREGRIVGEVFEPADWGTTSLTLRDNRAALTRSDADTGHLDVWLIDLARGIGSRMTTNESDDNHPVLSPDGRALVYTSTFSGLSAVHVKRLDTGEDARVDAWTGATRTLDWTPDGRYVLHEVVDQNGGDIRLLPVIDRGPARPILSTPFSESDPSVSPDGRWIAYVSNDSGRHEIYVQPFPSGERVRVSFDGGFNPRWSPDMRELFFMTPKAEIAAVGVLVKADRFECSVPKVLFRVPGRVAPPRSFRTAYAVAKDGRFLITLTPETPTPSTIDVAINWR